MGRVLNFYYDIISVHSWVMFERLCLVKASNTLDVINFKPIHASNVITTTGNKIPYFTPPLKKFYFHDIRFLGRLHGIPLKTPKGLIDDLMMSMTSSVAPQYLLTLIANRYPDRLVDASQLMWTMLWVENRTVHTDKDIAEIVEMLNLPSSVANELENDEWADELARNQNEAIESGCFGVPWLVFRDANKSRTYFGCDRWPLIRRNFSSGQRLTDKFHLFPQYGQAS